MNKRLITLKITPMREIDNRTDQEKLIAQAKAELTQAEAMKVLLENNDLGCEIHISRMIFGVCDNSWLMPIIDKQIKEIKKCIEGKPNKWQ